MHNQKNGSNNRRKAQQGLQKAHKKTTNIKEDIINKLVALIVLMATRIVVQDDPVKGWQSWWGRRIWQTRIGGYCVCDQKN